MILKLKLEDNTTELLTVGIAVAKNFELPVWMLLGNWSKQPNKPIETCFVDKASRCDDSLVVGLAQHIRKGGPVWYVLDGCLGFRQHFFVSASSRLCDAAHGI